MYKVFFNESIIKFDFEFKKSSNSNITKLVDTECYDFVNQLVCDIESTNKGIDFLILHQDISKVWTQFKRHFNIIGAAGGLVQNDESSLLFIKRLGVWDLPKGKIEKRESPENAAIREVEEECGLSELEIIRPLDSTFHIYRSPYLTFPKNLVLKETQWFLMHYSGSEIPAPQVEEDIEEVRWISASEMEEVMGNTYSSLREFLKNVLPLI
jgi:8-oxo-dGTP pyrophosphatase MutT (NUDIX family)